MNCIKRISTKILWIEAKEKVHLLITVLFYNHKERWPIPLKRCTLRPSPGFLPHWISLPIFLNNAHWLVSLPNSFLFKHTAIYRYTYIPLVVTSWSLLYIVSFWFQAIPFFPFFPSHYSLAFFLFFPTNCL